MAAEPDDPKVLARLADEGEADVAALRDSAEKWRNGVTTATGVISAVLVFKGPDPVAGMPMISRVVLYSVVALAVSAGIIASYCAVRASAGLPVEEWVPNTIDETLAHYQARRTRITGFLCWALGLSGLMVTLLLVSVALAWFLPRAGTEVARVESDDGRVVCGRLVRLTDDEVVVSVFDQHVVVPRTRVRALGEAQSCG